MSPFDVELDRLAKELAGRHRSRREALRMGMGVVAAGVASLFPFARGASAAEPNERCIEFCERHFPVAGGRRSRCKQCCSVEPFNCSPDVQSTHCGLVDPNFLNPCGCAETTEGLRTCVRIDVPCNEATVCESSKQCREQFGSDFRCVRFPNCCEDKPQICTQLCPA